MWITPALRSRQGFSRRRSPGQLLKTRSAQDTWVRCTDTRDSTNILPDLRFPVGAKDTNLHDDDRSDGLLGTDVLSQAEDVTIDFRTMSLMLRSLFDPTASNKN